MTDSASAAIVADLLHREGLYLDRQEWDAWLALYAEDAEFWVPAWISEHATTSDPDREVSLLYHDSRFGLEERVMRLRTRKSVTAMPLPRTVHFTSNILPSAADADSIEATASWMVQVFDSRTAKQYTHFGRYELRLRRDPGGPWRFARKRALLMNDVIPTVLDFYSI